MENELQVFVGPGPGFCQGGPDMHLETKKRKVLAREESLRVRKMVITSRKVVSAFPDYRLARKTSSGPSDGLNRVGARRKGVTKQRILTTDEKTMVIMRQNRGNGKCT